MFTYCQIEHEARLERLGFSITSAGITLCYLTLSPTVIFSTLLAVPHQIRVSKESRGKKYCMYILELGLTCRSEGHYVKLLVVVGHETPRSSSFPPILGVQPPSLDRPSRRRSRAIALLPHSSGSFPMVGQLEASAEGRHRQLFFLRLFHCSGINAPSTTHHPLIKAACPLFGLGHFLASISSLSRRTRILALLW